MPDLDTARIVVMLVGLLYALAMVALVVLFIVDWALHFRATRRFWKYGFVVGAVTFAIDLAAIVALPALRQLPVGLLAGLWCAIAGLRIALFCVVGMYSCMLLRRPDLPMLRRLFGARYYRGRIDVGNAVVATAVVTGAGVAWSVLLFALTRPHVAEPLRRMVEMHPGAMDFSAGAMLIGLSFAVAEEATFRLGLQSFLARHFRLERDRYWISILLVSAFWTIAHVGSLDPDWVKLAQIFPYGLALGWLAGRYGAEASILSHMAFNAALVPLSSRLIAS